MWVVAQSGELVNISEVRWFDCSRDDWPESPISGQSQERWVVRAFFTGKEKGPASMVLFQSEDRKAAQAVLHGIVMLTGAYNLRTVQGYGGRAAAEEDPDMEGGRAFPSNETVLHGLEQIK